jgi:PPOX class probable F420-dependent enzyme
MGETNGSTTPVRHVRAAKTVLLETRKRDGSWVATPVSLATHDGHLYFRSWNTAAKTKRLRNFPEVRVAPCTLAGKPTGNAMSGHARLLAGTDAARARRLLRRRFPVLHGVVVPLAHRLKGWTTLHYELDLDS